MPYLDKNGLAHLWSKVESSLAKKQGKVTPENGVYIKGAEIGLDTPVRDLTEEEYDALSDEEKENGLIFLPDDGEDSGGNTGGSIGGNVPSGGIIMWSGYVEAIPSGWALCDGDNGTPDLRGRFVLGASEAHPFGETGGKEEVTLTIAQMPKHDHFITASRKYAASGSAVNMLDPSSGAINTSEQGSSQPHPNMPPYYVLAFIMKL